MSESIITALISGGLALIGVVISNAAARSKMSSEIKTAQAVTDAKLDALTQEVRRHNNFAEKIPAMEARLNAVDKRIQGLEDADVRLGAQIVDGYSHR